MTKVELLNGLYAVARKKSVLNRQEKLRVRVAAEVLEKSLNEIGRLTAKIAELEEQLAIRDEGNGDLADDGQPFTEPEPAEDDWDDWWPLRG